MIIPKDGKKLFDEIQQLFVKNTLNKLRIDKNIFKLIKEIHTHKNQQLTLHWGFPGGSDGKESTYNVGGLGSIPGLGRSPG